MSEFEGEHKLLDEALALIYLHRHAYIQLTKAEHETLLGSVVKSYHDYFMSNDVVDPGLLEEQPSLSAMLERGFGLALDALPDLYERLQPLLKNR